MLAGPDRGPQVIGDPGIDGCHTTRLRSTHRRLLPREVSQGYRRAWARWPPPSGVLETHEAFEQGVRREVAEETGAQVEVERLTGLYKNVKAESSPPSSDAARSPHRQPRPPRPPRPLVSCILSSLPNSDHV
ncbi:MAG: NUDIX hydrolase [Pseudonocardiaceae bacterium]